MQFVFATGSEQSRVPALNAERVINMFTERQPQDSKTQAPLLGAHGLDAYVVAGTGPIRGFWTLNDLLYVVSGTSLYRIEGSGSVTSLGAGISGSGPVSMSDNGTQICIVNGANGWIYTTAGGLVQITSPNFFPADVVIFFDGYFVFNRVNTNQFFLSALFDGTSYSGTDFAGTESSAEPIKGIAQNLQLLFIFKPDLIELWYDAGAVNFPFQRYAGGIINVGCNSSHAILKQDGAIFFPGTDSVIYRLQANEPIRISTHAIEHLIAAEPTLANITGFTYTIEGHKFVGFTLPTAGTTIIYDISTGKWHERRSSNSLGSALGTWRVWQAWPGFFGGITLGDATTGQLWVPNLSTYTEGGFPLQKIVTSAPLNEDRRRIAISRFELDIQAGVGNGAAPNPQITLSVSKDGGNTFTAVSSKPMGAAGQYLTRLRWTRMGQARQWTFQLVCTDPVPCNFVGAYLDISVGI